MSAPSRPRARLLKPGLTAMAVVAVGVWASQPAKRAGAASPGDLQPPAGGPRLVSYQPLPAPDGQFCERPVAGSIGGALVPARSLSPGFAARAVGDGDENRAPVRVLHDDSPTFSAVAVDPVRNEIVLQDENLFQILVYDRLEDSRRTATSRPKRAIGGEQTKVGFNCALYVDPTNGDVYSVNNDVLNTMTVFSREAKGNVAPKRQLTTPHRSYGLAVDEDNDELFLTVQHPPRVVVYRKTASADAEPIRVLGGDHTGLEDPHGIAIDVERELVYVSNHGAVSLSLKEDGKLLGRVEGAGLENMIPGSGKYMPPSITVYPLRADGDVAPLRTIEGPRTELNWPAHIVLDPEHDELFVANDMGDSILVFRASDQGDVTPIRVLKGARTGVKNPTGLALDRQRGELIVANMANHTATVYPRAANGDTPPLRTIRAAPPGKEALMIGNPGAIAYDSSREEVLVPN